MLAQRIISEFVSEKSRCCLSQSDALMAVNPGQNRGDGASQEVLLAMHMTCFRLSDGKFLWMSAGSLVSLESVWKKAETCLVIDKLFKSFLLSQQNILSTCDISDARAALLKCMLTEAGRL